MQLTEYDVSFATKEYLLSKDYRLITWNPPGSQGTFTIPNPDKDPTYRGQTGSKAPDIIAFNDKEFLIVEAKDSLKKSLKDITKMNEMLNSSKRKDLLFTICKKQMEAIDLDFNPNELEIVFGIAFPKNKNISNVRLQETLLQKKLKVFMVSSLKNNWDNKVICRPFDYRKWFQVEEYIVKVNKYMCLELLPVK